MNELQFQKALCDLAKEAGGFGRKQSHKFFGGVADLHIKLPKFTAGVIECKWETIPKMGSTPVKMALTPLQRQYLTDYRKAGGIAGAILGVALRDGGVAIYPTMDLARKMITQEELHQCSLIKKRGQPWPSIQSIWVTLLSSSQSLPNEVRDTAGTEISTSPPKPGMPTSKVSKPPAVRSRRSTSAT